MNKTRFEEAKEIMMSSDFIDDVDKLEEILREYQDISDNSKALEYLDNKIMPSKLGNLKIGEDTIVMNENHGLNCFSDKMGYCENCNQCYGKKAPITYPNSFLFNLSAEINFNRLSVEEIINSIETSYKSELEAKKLKFMRFSEMGDFKSFKLFLKANEIAKHLYNKYGIISYTYTHNKELLQYKEAIKNSYIVVNWSIEAGNGFKHAITCNDVSKLENYFSQPEKYVICQGKCRNCSYCKDKDDLRTVVFVNHFSESMEKGLQAGLTETQLKELEAQKFIDYGLFLMKLNKE